MNITLSKGIAALPAVASLKITSIMDLLTCKDSESNESPLEKGVRGIEIFIIFTNWKLNGLLVTTIVESVPGLTDYQSPTPFAKGEFVPFPFYSLKY